MICAYCGTPLPGGRADFCRRYNMPGCCARHTALVIREANTGGSLWPSGWVGCSWRDQRGVWHYDEPDDNTTGRVKLPG